MILILKNVRSVNCFSLNYVERDVKLTAAYPGFVKKKGGGLPSDLKHQ